MQKHLPLQYVKEPTILPPSFMRGVAEGRGEPEYLHSKYSEIPTFLRKVGTPPTSLRSATSPMNGGGKSFFDTLKGADAKASAPEL